MGIGNEVSIDQRHPMCAALVDGHVAQRVYWIEPARV